MTTEWSFLFYTTNDMFHEFVSAIQGNSKTICALIIICQQLVVFHSMHMFSWTFFIYLPVRIIAALGGISCLCWKLDIFSKLFADGLEKELKRSCCQELIYSTDIKTKIVLVRKSSIHCLQEYRSTDKSYKIYKHEWIKGFDRSKLDAFFR